ncbi:MAG: thiamine pyrophosphate-dependent enzyme [Oscillospiraceae bacterium]
MPNYIKPQSIIKTSGYCPGCGHGVVQRIIAESLESAGLANSAINVVDIACCFWSLDALDYDGIAGPHGRCAAVATAVKKARPNATVFVHAGDGASYGIGIAETLFAASRDVPITMIIVNNGVFGMTGGQMCPATTMLGEKTTSCKNGRSREKYGEPVDMMKIFANYNIEFAARGALYDGKAIEQTSRYIRRGFDNQKENRGFSVIEILSPCPTNWNLSPVESQKRIKEVTSEMFPLGVYASRSGEVK